MAKVYMMCGKICSGKSTHAKELRKKYQAVMLSVDEITLALFGQNAGEKLDEYVDRTESYLYQKSLEIIETGTNVILDWGFWKKQERDFAKNFYRSRDIECEIHFVDIKDEEWYKRLEKRNEDVIAGNTNAYYVDDGLAEKFQSIFEKPDRDEIDVWIEQ